jgi:cystathionine beta-lyase/cystathionine gamma-synthase
VSPIPFAPTLGDVSTMISHPAVTSHRCLTAAAREALGIREGTIRVSVGIEELQLLEDEIDAISLPGSGPCNRLASRLLSAPVSNARAA